MNDLERIKRHLGKTIPIKFKNEDGTEDVFEFKPLNVGQQAILMELSRTMQKKDKIEIEVPDESNPEKMVKKEVPDIKKEDMLEMLELISDIVKTSIKELNEDFEEDQAKKKDIISLREEFCNNNFDTLSDALFELLPENSGKAKVKKLKEAIEGKNEPKSH